MAVPNPTALAPPTGPPATSQQKESSPQQAGRAGRSHRVRQAAGQALTTLAAEQARWQLRPGQLVIIDEASMVSTYQLAAIIAQATAAAAKVLLVGDPAQLDAIDAGGILGWLDRAGHTIHS